MCFHYWHNCLTLAGNSSPFSVDSICVSAINSFSSFLFLKCAPEVLLLIQDTQKYFILRSGEFTLYINNAIVEMFVLEPLDVIASSSDKKSTVTVHHCWPVLEIPAQAPPTYSHLIFGRFVMLASLYCECHWLSRYHGQEQFEQNSVQSGPVIFLQSKTPLLSCFSKNACVSINKSICLRFAVEACEKNKVYLMKSR